MVKRTSGERFFQVLNYAALAGLAFLTIYPFWNLVVVSVSGVSPLRLHEVTFWPLEPQLDAYRYLFASSLYWRSLRVTVAITVLGVAACVAMTALFAYPLSKRDFRWRKGLTLMIVVTMFFSGGLIPEYLLYKYLGLTNRFLVYIIPGAISTWNLLILRNFFQEIPAEIEDSARIDGAGELTILARIVFPMALPAIATITLWYAVGKWNTFAQCVYFTSSASLRTLQVAVRSLILDESLTGSYAQIDPVKYGRMSSQSIHASTIVASALPILLAYPFLQRYFVKGIMVGSLKG